MSGLNIFINSVSGWVRLSVGLIESGEEKDVLMRKFDVCAPPNVTDNKRLDLEAHSFAYI